MRYLSQSDDRLPQTVNFNYHIRPILSQNCFVCHGNDPSSREADLRLDTEVGAKALLHHGAKAIVEGNSKKSLLMQRIISEDPTFQMPPPEAKKKLTQREIGLLRKWIDQGAEWQEQWSLVIPKLPSLPFDNKTSKVTTAIDYLIEEALDEKGLEAVERADRNTLIRRVAYILTGLPPTIEELETYLNDNSERAYENMLEYYLGTSAYGERWARHWLDLVRYAESMGHEGDFTISHAWEYRDYVIRAFNQDVPYDQFVQEHLAGDQIQNPRVNPQFGFNESVIGTAYLYLGDGKHSPVNTRAEEADKIDNMIDVTSKTFQALTVSCSKCHDHKFDPIPTADYYSMYGMFESTRLVPKTARKPIAQLKSIDQLHELQSSIREKVGTVLIETLEQKEAKELKTTIEKYIRQSQNQKTIELDTSLQLFEDFRDGKWEGWYTDGRAFKNQSTKMNELINPYTYEDKKLGFDFLTSRYLAPGVQGVISSPNFKIESDYIAIRAAGHGGTVRIVVDNFQVIRAPLWGELQARVDDPEWETYVLDVRLAKGRKAYLEFFPGSFNHHVFNINPDDYIDVQYALAFSGDHPIKSIPLAQELSFDLINIDLRQAVDEWVLARQDDDQAKVVSILQQELLTGEMDELLSDDFERYKKLASQLYDSTHFIGLMDGQAVYSPIFNKGNFEDLSTEKMPHQFLSAVEAGPDSFPQYGSGRIAWAEALIDPDNPLTSRVMVNRIWHHVFGKGIVETVDNFGLQGTFPTHPALLDYLAIAFIENGWSIKLLLKQILLTQTFQQSSIANKKNMARDPTNDFLHHYPVRRLEAEAIRDGILATAGCLDKQMYGPSVPIHLTEFMTGRGRPAESGPLDSYGRRSIYRSVRRNFIPPFMQTFDLPIPFSTFGKRNTTNVPAQSLALLNDPFIHEQAGYWAANVLQPKNTTTKSRIFYIYKKAFARLPSDNELAQAVEFLNQQALRYGVSFSDLQDSQMLWKEYCHSLFNAKEFIHLL